MSTLLLIGVGGASGALARHAVNQVASTQFDSVLLGTFIANISGSLILGLSLGFLSSHTAWQEEARLFLAVGFLGSYTTFSTLSVASVQLLERGDLSSAAINLAGSVALGLIAALAGLLVGRAI